MQVEDFIAVRQLKADYEAAFYAEERVARRP
jgi:hypothetical protein